MGNVASIARTKVPQKKKKVTKKKTGTKPNASNQAPPVKFTLNSKACTYNAASNHWRCVHRRAGTVNNLNNNNWDGFWVNTMPYSIENDNDSDTKQKAKKKMIK